MNSHETVDLHTAASTEATASGAWSVLAPSRYEVVVAPLFIGSAAAALLALAGTATAFDESLWLAAQGQQAVKTVATEQVAIAGRRVSRAEALRISRRVLERAERERLAVAENEARRGMQLEG